LIAYFLGNICAKNCRNRTVYVKIIASCKGGDVFEFLRHGVYMGCTLAPPGEYDWTVHVRRRFGLMSNYFDHLLYSSS